MQRRLPVQPGKPINGKFETPYGQMTFKQDETQVLGQGTCEEPTLGALFSSLSGGTPTEVTVRTVKFEANIAGRSGRFRVETHETKKGSPFINFPKSTTSQGLLITAPEGESFEILQEQETEVKIHKARKIGS
jgi:hypothetical protein